MTDQKKIAELNDRLRARVGVPHFGVPDVPGKVYMTRGIAALPPEDVIEIWFKVRDFDDFNEDNDLYGERIFGAFQHKGHSIYWKIDYYAPDMKWGSENPADTSQTMRVLTIMLAEEN